MNLAQVAENHPRFLRRQLQAVVAAMLQIATAENLEEATRQLAAEFLVVLCEAREKAPGMMRKLPSFSQSIFQIMLTFLLDIEVRTSPPARVSCCIRRHCNCSSAASFRIEDLVTEATQSKNEYRIQLRARVSLHSA